MRFELAFEAMRHGLCITVQENGSIWYRWNQSTQALCVYVENMFMTHKLDFPTDRIMSYRWRVGVYIEGNTPLWFDTEKLLEIQQIMQYAEIALEEREQRLAGVE